NQQQLAGRFCHFLSFPLASRASLFYSNGPIIIVGGMVPFFMPMPMKNHRIDSINLSSIGAISRRNDRGFSGT
ncbi:hypothetical protein, partial [Thiolapillus sp.]|uniref:hypothetical protein n=1 Tax=Thiolapillus sp. TaxID=2017437 RepID=UPI003AF4773B